MVSTTAQTLPRMPHAAEVSPFLAHTTKASGSLGTAATSLVAGRGNVAEISQTVHPEDLYSGRRDNPWADSNMPHIAFPSAPRNAAQISPQAVEWEKSLSVYPSDSITPHYIESNIMFRFNRYTREFERVGDARQFSRSVYGGAMDLSSLDPPHLQTGRAAVNAGCLGPISAPLPHSANTDPVMQPF
jgi:hypothetical protein